MEKAFLEAAVDVGHHDPGPLLGQTLAVDPADTVGSLGDDNHLVLEAINSLSFNRLIGACWNSSGG